METNLSFLELYNKDKQSSLVKRFLFFCFNLFFSLDEGINVFSLFDSWISQEGISKASGRFCENFRVDIEPIDFKKLDEQSAYLIYGNHPILGDPLAVISVLNWDQIKLFAEINLLKTGSNFSKHIFPIKGAQLIEGRPRKKILLDWIYYLFFRSLVDYYDRKEALVYNRTQVEKAAEFLANGGKFMIFPCGQRKMVKREYFRNGIGFILSKAMQKPYCKEIKILPFFVNINHPNLFSLQALFRFRKKRMKMRVFFGQEVDATIYKDLISDPEKLATKLADDYLGFVRNLKR